MDDIYSLSEEDIKLRYITPAIVSKEWSVEDITMETKVKLTDGQINLRGTHSNLRGSHLLRSRSADED